MERREAGRLLCDFLSGGNTAEARLEKLSPADKESLVDWSLRFKVGGLFYREIRALGSPIGILPAGAGNRLRDAYRSRATVNTRLFLDAAVVLRSLAGHRLPVIALKGLALAEKLYGDIALRPMSDIDLLVKEEDLVRAGRILMTLGYRPYEHAWESLLKTHCHLPPFANTGGTMIELHWDIVESGGPLRTDLDGLWKRACPIEIRHVAARALSPEDLLLHLCLHAWYHLRTGMDLIPFCDIAALMKASGEGFDWRIAGERADRWGARKCVYLMLLLVRDLLGAAPPDRILSEMKPDDYRTSFFDEALEQLFDVSASGQLMKRRIIELAKISKARGLRGKATAFYRGAFPSRDYLARFDPILASSPKLYRYYFFRLGRLLAYAARVLFRRTRRDPTTVTALDQAHRMRAVSRWMFSSRS